MNNVAYLRREQQPLSADGRRRGQHGHRIPIPVQRQVRRELAAVVRTGERLPADVVDRAMQLTGATRRTIQRWADDERRRLIVELDEQPELAAEQVLLGLRAIAAGGRPRFRATRALIEEVTAYPSLAAAYATLHDTPGHPVERVSRSTFYAALADVHPAVGHGRRHGTHRLRETEMHLQRVRRIVRVNESWSTDEFDTKVDVEVGGVLVSPKVVSFRDEATGLPVGYVVLPHAATSDDVVALFGSCVIGWEADGVAVHGAPRRVRSDQGAPFISEDTRRRLAYCGTTLDPTASYNPQANGAQERFHRDLLEELMKVRANSRRAKDRRKQPYADGAATFDEVVAAVDAVMANRRFVHRPAGGRHAGQTALQVYGQRVAEGRVERLDVDDAGLAETALPLRNLRKVEPRKGVYVRGEYFTSYTLAAWGRQQDVQVRVLPAHPEMAFVFDNAGDFIATVWHPDALPAEDALAIIRLREERERWVDGMHKRTAAARGTAAGAAPADDGGRTVIPGSPEVSTPAPAAPPLHPATLAAAPELRELLTSPALLTALRALTDEQLAELRTTAAHDVATGTTTGTTTAAAHEGAVSTADGSARAGRTGRAGDDLPVLLDLLNQPDPDGDH